MSSTRGSNLFLRLLETKFTPVTSRSRMIRRGPVVSVRGDSHADGSRVYTDLKFQTNGQREPRCKSVRNSLGRHLVYAFLMFSREDNCRYVPTTRMKLTNITLGKIRHRRIPTT